MLLVSVCLIIFFIIRHFHGCLTEDNINSLLSIASEIFVAMVPVFLEILSKQNKTRKSFNPHRIYCEGNFVDRKQESKDIYDAIIFADDRNLSHRITISAQIGMGKTSLAHHICNDINFESKKNWGNTVAYYLQYDGINTIKDCVLGVFGDGEIDTVGKLSNMMHKNHSGKCILIIDGINAVSLRDARMFADAFISCDSRKNYIIMFVDRNEADDDDIRLSEFKEHEVHLLADSLHISISPRESASISEKADGFPIYVRYFVESHAMDCTEGLIRDMEEYIRRTLNNISEDDKKLLTLAILMCQVGNDEINTDTLLSVIGRGGKISLNHITDLPLITYNKKDHKLHIGHFIGKKYLDFLEKYIDNTCLLIYGYFRDSEQYSYAVYAAVFSHTMNVMPSEVSFLMEKVVNAGQFYFICRLVEATKEYGINPMLANDKNFMKVWNRSYLQALFETGHYESASNYLDRYYSQTEIDEGILDTDVENFDYHYMKADLEHLTNNFETASNLAFALIKQAPNPIAENRAKYLYAHILRHMGYDLDWSVELFQEIKESEDVDDRTLVRTLYSIASIRMFQCSTTYDYDSTFNLIDTIIDSDNNNRSFGDYVARHKGIYALEYQADITVAINTYQDAIRNLSISNLRIIYDIFFELAEVYRLEEKNEKLYKMSKEYYLKAQSFAEDEHDINLLTSCKMGLLLLDLKYGNDISMDTLLNVKHLSTKCELLINMNEAEYLISIARDGNISEEMINLWKHMGYGRLWKAASGNNMQLKLTVM